MVVPVQSGALVPVAVPEATEVDRDRDRGRCIGTQPCTGINPTRQCSKIAKISGSGSGTIRQMLNMIRLGRSILCILLLLLLVLAVRVMIMISLSL
jgi:hypothetical protein